MPLAHVLVKCHLYSFMLNQNKAKARQFLDWHGSVWLARCMAGMLHYLHPNSTGTNVSWTTSPPLNSLQNQIKLMEV